MNDLSLEQFNINGNSTYEEYTTFSAENQKYEEFEYFDCENKQTREFANDEILKNQPTYSDDPSGALDEQQKLSDVQTTATSQASTLVTTQVAVTTATTFPAITAIIFCVVQAVTAVVSSYMPVYNITSFILEPYMLMCVIELQTDDGYEYFAEVTSPFNEVEDGLEQQSSHVALMQYVAMQNAEQDDELLDKHDQTCQLENGENIIEFYDLVPTVEYLFAFYVIETQTGNRIDIETRSFTALEEEYAFCEHLNPSDWEVGLQPTCENEGYRYIYCLDCNEQLEYEQIQPLGHDIVIGEEVDATCTEEGYTIYMCQRCGDNYIDNYIQALGHDYEAVTTDATCTEEGYTTYTCQRCSDNYTDNYTDALGHSYDIQSIQYTQNNPTANTPLNLTSEGTFNGNGVLICERCNDKIEDTCSFVVTEGLSIESEGRVTYQCDNNQISQTITALKCLQAQLTTDSELQIVRLIVPENSTLTIVNGATLVFNETSYNYGTVNNYGSLIGNEISNDTYIEYAFMFNYGILNEYNCYCEFIRSYGENQEEIGQRNAYLLDDGSQLNEELISNLFYGTGANIHIMRDITIESMETTPNIMVYEGCTFTINCELNIGESTSLINNGTIISNGLYLNGTFTNNGTITSNGLYLSGTLINNGICNITIEEDNEGQIDSYGVLINNSGSSVNISGNGQIVGYAEIYTDEQNEQQFRYARIENYGTFTIGITLTGTGQIDCQCEFNNYASATLIGEENIVTTSDTGGFDMWTINYYN